MKRGKTLEAEYWNLALGSAAGVLTAPAALWLTHTCRTLLLEWIEAWAAPGFDVSGTWHGPDIAIAGASEVRLSLFQTGHRIRGTATFVWPRMPSNALFPSDEAQLRTVRVVGHLDNGFIYLTFRLPNHARLGVNGFLLEIKDQGRKLTGCFFFYSSGLGRPTKHMNSQLYKIRSLSPA